VAGGQWFDFRRQQLWLWLWLRMWPYGFQFFVAERFGNDE
jgi:hypothetical protein